MSYKDHIISFYYINSNGNQVRKEYGWSTVIDIKKYLELGKVDDYYSFDNKLFFKCPNINEIEFYNNFYYICKRYHKGKYIGNLYCWTDYQIKHMLRPGLSLELPNKKREFLSSIQKLEKVKEKDAVIKYKIKIYFDIENQLLCYILFTKNNHILINVYNNVYILSTYEECKTLRTLLTIYNIDIGIIVEDSIQSPHYEYNIYNNPTFLDEPFELITSLIVTVFCPEYIESKLN